MRLTNEFPNLYQFYILQANKFFYQQANTTKPQNNIKRERQKKGKLHLFIIPKLEMGAVEREDCAVWGKRVFFSSLDPCVVIVWVYTKI